MKFLHPIDANLGNDRRRNRNYFVSTTRIRDLQTYPLSYDAPSFDPTKYGHFESVFYNSSEKQILGKRLFEKIKAFQPVSDHFYIILKIYRNKFRHIRQFCFFRSMLQKLRACFWNMRLTKICLYYFLMIITFANVSKKL